MEPCAQKTTKKHNPELVDTVFRLMFEILWVAPYDRRRSNAALSEFERCGRETAVLLAATEVYQKKCPFYKKYRNCTWYGLLSWFVTLNLVMVGFLIFSGALFT